MTQIKETFIMPIAASAGTVEAEQEKLASEDRMDRSGIRALSRAIEVLRSLADCPDGLSLREIGRTISLPRSTVQRIVETLSKEGFLIAASPTAKVRLGPAILQLAANMDFDIKQILRPFLRDLGADTRETVDISVQDGGSVVLIDQIIGSHGLIATSVLGEHTPLHSTANGRAILAAMSAQDARRGLAHSIREHGRGPLFDEDRFWRNLDTIRTLSISFDRGDSESGVSVVSAPIKVSSIGLFAVSIRVPIQRFLHNEVYLAKKLQDCRRLIISRLS